MNPSLVPDVEILILGPVAVRRGDLLHVPPSARMRTLLGALALAGPHGLSGTELAHAVWPERGSGQHRSTLTVAVHRARRWLAEVGGDAIGIDSTGTGYALAGDIDAWRFGDLVVRARTEPAGVRIGLLGQALELWRADDPVAGVAVGAGPAGAVEALVHSRLATAVRYGTDLLGQGRAAEAVGALQRLADGHPLEEPVQAALIEALAAAGRQAESLHRYERLRVRLAEELGVDPGPELVAAHLRVLRREPGSQWVPAAVPAQLPPDIAGFTGRAAQLAELTRLRAAARESVVISAVDGVGGVGKTALAVRWARQVASEFSDGQLYVDLRGHSHGEPVEAVEALGGFLRALGVPAEHVPSTVDEAAALYRSVLAGRRVLVLLDNARDTAQVRPLLPAATGCLALITSRDRLDGLVALDGAGRIAIDVLGPDEGLAVLATALGPARLAAEPDAARELVALCGRLPLALRVTAAPLAAAPERRLAEQVAALREDRWEQLSLPGDPRFSVRTAFDLSYQHLAPADRRLFRLLGTAPGVDIGVPAAAATAAAGVTETRRSLRALAAAHLIRERGDRYSMHDLLGLYARDRAAEAGEGTGEVARLAAWYLQGVDAAARLLYPSMRRLPPVSLPPVAPRLDHADQAAALAWLDAEWPNLVAVVLDGAGQDPPDVAIRLADALRGYFWLRRPLAEWRTVAQAAHAAAVTAGDPWGQAAAQLSLGMLHHCAGRFAQAVEHFEQVRDHSARIGWRDGESSALGNLGLANRALGRLPAAVDAQVGALAAYRREGRPGGIVMALCNLGVSYVQIGDLDRAVEHFTEALAIHREAGSRDGQAMALNNLGQTYHLRGQLDDALAALTAGYELYVAGGSLHGQADALVSLAAVHRDAGRTEKALEQARAAHGLAIQAADQRVEADALNVLGSVLTRLGRRAEAAERHRGALTLARVNAAPYHAVQALLGLVAAEPEPAELAAGRARQALDMARANSYGLLVARAESLLAVL